MSEKLRFSVEESVWFERGQEVSDLLALSLDPDITIQEHSQHVSIKGALELSGDYRKAEHTNELDERNFEAFSTRAIRTIDHVSVRDDGTCSLKHRFPIDITVPKNRINDLDDVYITIETFDYELPERGCLKLSADLAISGILNTQRSETLQQTGTPIEPATSITDTNESSIESPVRVAAESMRNETPSEFTEKEEDDVVKERHPEEQRYESGYEEQDLPEVAANGETMGESSPAVEKLEVEVRKSSDLSESDKVKPLYPQVEMKTRAEQDEYTYAVPSHTGPSVNASEEEMVEKVTKQRDENALYLTKFLADDEDDFSRLKMYIIQQGDSLESIAEKYDVQVSQLLRVNKLESEGVSEGQVLYIPVFEKSNV